MTARHGLNPAAQVSHESPSHPAPNSPLATTSQTTIHRTIAITVIARA